MFNKINLILRSKAIITTNGFTGALTPLMRPTFNFFYLKKLNIPNELIVKFITKQLTYTSQSGTIIFFTSQIFRNHAHNDKIRNPCIELFQNHLSEGFKQYKLNSKIKQYPSEVEKAVSNFTEVTVSYNKHAGPVQFFLEGVTLMENNTNSSMIQNGFITQFTDVKSNKIITLVGPHKILTSNNVYPDIGIYNRFSGSILYYDLKDRRNYNSNVHIRNGEIYRYFESNGIITKKDLATRVYEIIRFKLKIAEKQNNILEIKELRILSLKVHSYENDNNLTLIDMSSEIKSNFHTYNDIITDKKLLMPIAIDEYKTNPFLSPIHNTLKNNEDLLDLEYNMDKSYNTFLPTSEYNNLSAVVARLSINRGFGVLSNDLIKSTVNSLKLTSGIII